MKVLERFIKYVKIHTTSCEENEMHSPSFAGELDLANLLAEEMRDLGVSEVRVDENGYVYGRIPASAGYESCMKLGLIAHMDTAPDYNGKDVKPQIIRDYDGESVALGEGGLKLETEMFPHLKNLKGRTLVTTDGSSLLGADDKAGIAEIMTVAEALLKDSTILHGEIDLAFTPDEEIGSGAELLDLESFGADAAYTLDGGIEGELSFENFNACGASVVIHGKSIHPGEAKNKMRNASLLAMEFNGMLPAGDIPACTEKYEGFYHLTNMQGNEEKAELSYIVRDHDAAFFQFRKYTLEHITQLMNEKYGEGTVELNIKDSYRNMREMIEPHMELIRYATEAMEAVGVVPEIEPIRGGTDGARLSFRGLPCPNLGTGCFAFHGPYEHITEEGMELTVRIVLQIIEKIAGRG